MGGDGKHRVFWVDRRPTMPLREELPLVTLEECRNAGMSTRAVDWKVSTNEWQRPHRGVFVTHSGPIDWATSASAAILAAGEGAALEGWSAAYPLGLTDEPEGDHRILLPTSRRIAAPVGSRVRYADRPVRLLGAWPPRTNLDWTVVQITKSGSDDDALAAVGAVLQRRMSTPARLLATLALERRHPRRRLLADVLRPDAAGAESALELRWVRDVERPHRIPAGRRQLRDRDRGAGRRYDIGYGIPAGHLTPDVDPLSLAAFVVELDGMLFHRGRGAVDRRKANALTRRGKPLLRYGWSEVAGDPCAVAAEIAAFAHDLGLPWPARPCRRPGCPIGPASMER